MVLFYLGSIGNIYGEGKPPVRRRSPALCAQAEKRHPGRIGVPWEQPLASPLGRGGRAQRGRRGKTMILSFENGCTALSVTCGDSSPKGRAGELDPVTSVTSYVGMKNGAYLYRYAPLTVLRAPIERNGLFCVISACPGGGRRARPGPRPRDGGAFAPGG